MFQSGFVFRGKKLVYWSVSSRTALADAEIEYLKRHMSRSCCRFDAVAVSEDYSSALRNSFASGLAVFAWTTTSWTLPYNRAISIDSKMKYDIVRSLHSSDPASPSELYRTLSPLSPTKWLPPQSPRRYCACKSLATWSGNHKLCLVFVENEGSDLSSIYQAIVTQRTGPGALEQIIELPNG